jgi:hypothetical protein
MGNEPRRYDLVTSAAQHFLPFALHGQHLNVGQVPMGAIQAGNDRKVSENRHPPLNRDLQQYPVNDDQPKQHHHR